ncbi:NADH dehydrogenase [ubiquinone] 1 beta subcomplex subunit 11, mitochondrial [Labrus bergylta]|uniref:NADH dehydrogenase [ubiquinone] 1 beta subcomplex subunit 11, mitochondrial n=1 Tax=Labrus bergylta TaxID=56723 RepID=A0A3Q3FKT1_9LABR|nr:NADH dehydrogenase [ubiquinone] 1 beta subcomplex subunit 11, mitochondrial [Labrus bergylta]
MLTRLLRLGPALPRLLLNQPARFVSQSKPSGSAGSAAVTQLHPAVDQGGHGEVDPYLKNPDYHGFSQDPHVDLWNMRMAFFCGISVVLVIGGTFLAYIPDNAETWGRREAERLIVQREAQGLPLISENYYDPSTIVLPTAGEE